MSSLSKLKARVLAIARRCAERFERYRRPAVMIPISLLIGAVSAAIFWQLQHNPEVSGLWLALSSMSAAYFLGAPCVAGMMELADR
jgi:hypothetical protein